jgi:hypothetical protein
MVADQFTINPTNQQLTSRRGQIGRGDKFFCDIYVLMDTNQHFFLSAAGESIELAKPRECWEINRMRIAARDDYMLISMEPPYRQPLGIGYRDIYKLIIATRFKGYSLYPITSWPCDVSVFLTTGENIAAASDFKPDQIQCVAWAMLFRTLAEAETHSKKFP